MIRKLFRKKPIDRSPARTAAGERVYAIGDIHGRLDCLDELLALIARDDAARGPADTTVVFLGDYVDRGPDSCGVLERLIELTASSAHCIFLMGNHEEIMQLAAKGERAALLLFNRVGGKATMLSYGVSIDTYEHSDLRGIAALLNERVPLTHFDFISQTQLRYVSGDYVFVHAGVRPGIELDEQKASDLRWIRQEFLSHRGDFGYVVVHGHTVTEQVETLNNRIGIDTGAYASGRLTAIGLEGEDRWFLTADAGVLDGAHALADAALDD